MEMKSFVGTFEFYEKALNGEWDTEPHCYCKTGDTEEQVKDYKDLIWQALEIENIGNTEILVVAEFTKDGEYLDRDEFVISVDIVRTDKPSRFIKWGDKKPHIFEIDRNRSRIEYEAN